MPHHHHKHAFVTPTAADQTPAAVVPADDERDPKARPATAEAIRLCAYAKWETAGRPSGDGVEFWLEAEQESAPAR